MEDDLVFSGAGSGCNTDDEDECTPVFESGSGNYIQYILHDYTWCVQVLRSPKEAFAAAMQSWRERCEKCVCLQGDYIEK